MRTCPEPRELKELINGTLDGSRTVTVSRHIEDCFSCQSALDAMTSSVLPTVDDVPGERPSESFLNRLKEVGPPSGNPLTVTLPEIPGYEILRELGRGGVGAVYQARQLSLNRIVALKVLLGGDRVKSAELSRFRIESMAVGKLNHPGIVQVYEVGEWRPAPEAKPLPYLCLEYVAGGTLGRRMNHTPQSAVQSAEWLREMATAVHSAHEQGIIHRDIKPENVLLDAITDKPKLTDFGLAKEVSLEAGQTQTGMILGTPGYMAPEQARGDVRAMNATTDVHGLGAALYEMLTGRPPFLGPTTLDTILMVVSAEPIPPRQIQPGVPRDLETICLKCLEKQQKRRYPSALALADDLRRFLDGRPISARPVGPVGRVLKWTRRNPLPAALSALLIVVVLGSLIGLSALYLDAETQRKLSDDARVKTEEALVEARTANELAKKASVGAQTVSAFFQKNVLAAPRPKGEGGGTDITLRRAIEEAEAKISDQFKGQPEYEAAVRDTLVNTYYSLALFDKARIQAERVLALKKSYLEADDPEIFSAQNNLALSCLQTGRFEEAGRLLRETLDGRSKRLGEDDPATLASMNSLSGFLIFSGRLAEAATLLKQAIAIHDRKSPNDTASTLTLRGNLGSVLSNLERFEEAEPIMRAVLRERETTLAPDHADTILTTTTLGELLRKTHRREEAGKLLERGLVASKKTFGLGSPQYLRARLQAIYLIGEIDIQKGHAAFLQALRECSPTLPTKNPDRLLAISDWVNFLLDHQQPILAAPLIDEVVSIRRETLAPDNPLLATTILLHAESQLAQDKPAEAEKLAREVLAIREKKLPTGHWMIASAKSFLGDCLLQQNQLQAAEKLLLESQAVLEKTADTPKARLASSRDRLRRLYTQMGKPDEAAKW